MDDDHKELSIGLFWHSPNSDNLGVGALTISNIKIIREAAQRISIKPVFTLFGFVDDREVYVKDDDVRIIQLNNRRIFSPWSDIGKEISECDIIVDIGGGDSFTDIYGWKRFLFLTVSKMWVINNKVPLILSPQTLGPFQSWYKRQIASWIARQAAMVFARDRLSFDYAVEDMGIDDQGLFLSTDVAFVLPYTKAKTYENSTCTVGVNVSGLLFNGGYTGDNEFGLELDYPTLIRKVIAYLIEQDCRVFLVANVISQNFKQEDDYRVCRRLADEYSGVEALPAFADPISAKSAIAQMDFFIGARMHACIAALSSGVPVVPMAYSRKFSGLFGALDYHHTLDCMCLDTEQALIHIQSAFINRDKLKLDTDNAVNITRSKIDIYRNQLSLFMAKVSEDA